jgi:hypothetical protein
MIYIDFQPGAHGAYLEYVCNHFVAGQAVNGLPFDSKGSSHGHWHVPGIPVEFLSGHHYADLSALPNDYNMLSIQILPNDLLPMMSICLLRAGGLGIDNDLLEQNTFHKLGNSGYKLVLDNIIDKYFKHQFQESYQAVKDASWPDIATIDEFNQLPDWIQTECMTTHNLKLLTLTSEQPDCPRYILREIFKLSFKNPAQSWPMLIQDQMNYATTGKVFVIPYASFYNTDLFIDQLKKVAQTFGFNFVPDHEFMTVHAEFLKRQPYKYAGAECDFLFDNIVAGKSFEISNLDLLEESYLSAKLELHYNKELPFEQPKWFTHSTQIQQYFNGTS